MSKVNFQNELEKAEKEFGVGGSNDQWFKIAEGENVVRILTPLFPYASHFKKGACLGKAECPECQANAKEPDEKKHNKAAVKFICRLLDKKDNAIKTAQLPYTIYKALATYQNDPDYAFDEVPMPYDIKINAEGAGTKEVQYTVVARPQRTEIAAEVLEKLNSLHSPEQIIEAMQNKRRKDLGFEKQVDAMSPAFDSETYPKDENVEADEIPF